jgi:GntR family transcriptional regulator
MELPIRLQKDSGIPLYLQLQEQLRLLIKQGELHAGDLMPTVRELAVTLEINSNTVARVYRDLQREGWLVLRRGVGTFVAQAAPAQPLAKRDLRGLEQKARELIAAAKQLGISSTELFQFLETRWKEHSDVER